MQVVTGKSISDGIAIGPLRILKKREMKITAVSGLTPEEEWRRCEKALQEAKEQLDTLYARARQEIGEEDAAIFGTHRMMLEDEDYLTAVKNFIETQRATAEYAVSETGRNFAGIFAGMEDAYMQARSADVTDVSQRVVGILTGTGEEAGAEKEPAILAAEELTPSETLQLDKTKILGFLTKYGSINSHTAILARSMGIPALSGVDFDECWEGRPAAIDSYEGCVYLEPEARVLSGMRARQDEEQRKRSLLQELKDAPDVTLDGREIEVCANVGSEAEAEAALESGARGIGLFRSEFIYLRTDDYPAEEEQFSVYRQVAEAMAGKRVVIRTLDIGADKQAGYFELEPEENPALGYRAIRICLTRREMFKQQLRAILRAGAYGKVDVMFPMIISLRELQEAKKLLEECRAELKEQGLPAGDVGTGVMIETPAAVMIADELAREVDFFSLGTNDLTQYALAIDRQNPNLDAFYDAHHPAVLRMIRMAAEAGRRHGCRVGICGELAADLELTETFLRMGIDELSVAPASVLLLRRQIRSLDLGKPGEGSGTGEQGVLDRTVKRQET